MAKEKEKYGIIANHKGNRYVKRGAKCFILFDNPGGGGERVKVSCISRGGRRIETFVGKTKLYNFRCGYIPPLIRNIYEKIGIFFDNQKNVLRKLEAYFG